MKEKINLIARLLLVQRKIEDLKDKFARYEYNKAMAKTSKQSYDLEFDERYYDTQKEWCALVAERTDIEERLSKLVKESV